MLVVRKEGKAHNQYNSFRSAFELLEAVGREPHDGFEETNEDLQKLAHTQQQMQQIDGLLSGFHELKTENEALRMHNEQQMQQIKQMLQ